MCRDNPSHSSPYVTAGKITAIGRIYAATPERGAGSSRVRGISLAEAIARRLAETRLDRDLDDFGFEELFGANVQEKVVLTHSLLVDEIAAATKEWSLAADNNSWKPRIQASFASKYLHFHRPNAFPIMDSFAKAGLTCADITGTFNTYQDFCAGVIEYTRNIDCDWTPRSVDTVLVDRGRDHSHRVLNECVRCKKTHRKRRGRHSSNFGGEPNITLSNR